MKNIKTFIYILLYIKHFKNMIQKLEFKSPENYNKQKTISISTVLGMISEPFDSDAVAQKTYDKNFNNPESKYYQMTKEQILESWAEKGATSCKYGSQLDDYIGICLTGNETEKELFYMDYIDGDERMEGLAKSFDRFYNEKIKNGSLEFVNREQYLYFEVEVDGELWHVRGRFDCLFYNKETGRYVIVDWKSNGEIETEPTKWTKKLLGPAKSLYDLSGIKYTTQVYFYKMALESLPLLVKNDIVDVAIVNLSGYNENKEPQLKIITALYPYEKTFIESILKYAIKKKILMDSKNG